MCVYIGQTEFQFPTINEDIPLWRDKPERYEEVTANQARFAASKLLLDEWLPNYHIPTTKLAGIILPGWVPQKGAFGYVAGGFKFNLRIEGYLNKKNVRDYDGPLLLLEEAGPHYETVINRPCLIPVNFFVENPEGNKSHKFVVQRADQRVFFLAGAYQVREVGGTQQYGFAILTKWANNATEALGHHRCPVIVPYDSLNDYLIPTLSKAERTELLWEEEMMDWEVYEIDAAMAKRNIDLQDGDPDIIQPIGEVVRVGW